MKKILLIIFATFIALASVAKTDDGAKIEFADKVHDFGTIDQDGGDVKADFVFTNTGTAPLVIIDATASCGCTRPTFPKKAIAPGKKGTITVKFNPKGQPKSFTKVVTVITNDPRQARVKLRIKGKIKK